MHKKVGWFFSTLFLCSIPNVSAHGGADDVGWFRTMLGGFEAMVISGFFHTTGAMILLAGLILLAAKLPKKDEAVLLEQNLGGKTATKLIIIGMVMNLGGGIMRLYEPGHPDIFSAFEVRWVSIMIVKHLMIVVLCIISGIAISNRFSVAKRKLMVKVALGLTVLIGVLGSLAGVVGPL